MEKPDLSQVSPAVLEYILYLEAELERINSKPSIHNIPLETVLADADERPTSINIITMTTSGNGKRTPRHEYSRQRRGGMGVFDLEAPDDDSPVVLSSADENQHLLLLTTLGRGFRLSPSRIPVKQVHSRGESIIDRLPFEKNEQIAAILPTQASGYIAMISKNGMVRCLRHHLFGEYLKPGTAFFSGVEFGPLAAACWTPGDGELLIATRKGMAIRFAEKLVPPQGTRGIRVEEGDEVVAITSVDQESGVFMLGSDGKGTIRVMAGFNPNKSAGGGGKLGMKTDQLVAAFSILPQEDIFIISQLGKIIRFQASEVPQTEGVIQGVICMSLRSDECVYAIKAGHGEPI